MDPEKGIFGLEKKDTKMIENVKKSLDDFLDRLSPEAIDSMLAELNAEYEKECWRVCLSAPKAGKARLSDNC